MTTAYEIGSVQSDPLQLWSKEVLWGREGRTHFKWGGASGEEQL